MRNLNTIYSRSISLLLKNYLYSVSLISSIQDFHSRDKAVPSSVPPKRKPMRFNFDQILCQVISITQSLLSDIVLVPWNFLTVQPWCAPSPKAPTGIAWNLPKIKADSSYAFRDDKPKQEVNDVFWRDIVVQELYDPMANLWLKGKKL